MPEERPLDPSKTICVCYHKGREVGRIPATAPNASAYMQTLAEHYKELSVKYEYDRNAGLLALLHQPVNRRY